MIRSDRGGDLKEKGSGFDSYVAHVINHCDRLGVVPPSRLEMANARSAGVSPRMLAEWQKRRKGSR